MRRIRFYALAAMAVVALVSPPAARHAFASAQASDGFLRTQAESDFDRDGDIDFLDFTVFSAFYSE